MKAVKIILGIVIVLTLAFFATGLIVKEVKYSVEIDINKPIAEVFAKFENPKLLKEWMPEIKSIETIDEKPGKIGSTYKMIVENQGQEMLMTEKIMAYVLNEKMTFQFNSDRMLKTDDFNFVANGSKTKMIQNCSVKSKVYLAACVFPYYKWKFEEASQEYMNKFKTMVESN